MNITTFKEALDYLTKAELTPFVWGKAGIGKTSVVKQYAQEKGYKFFPFYLGTQSDSGDILGLAEFVVNDDGTKSTEFAKPKWMSDVIQYCFDNPDSGAIIFFDEFNRARRDILSGMFSLTLDKRFHTVVFPKNCHFIAAGNPPTDEYFVTDIDETALMARFVHIRLEPTLGEWMSYAKERQIDPTLVGFIQDQPQLLEDPGQHFDLPVKVDRRSYERLNALMKLKAPPHIMEGLMPGIIGLERTIAYQAYLKDSDKPLTGDEVLSGEKSQFVEKWSDPTNIMSSLLNITVDNLRAKIQELNKEDRNLDPVQKTNLMKFLLVSPKDITFPLIKELVMDQNKVFKNFYLDPLYEKQVSELAFIAKGLNNDKK